MHCHVGKWTAEQPIPSTEVQALMLLKGESSPIADTVTTLIYPLAQLLPLPQFPSSINTGPLSPSRPPRLCHPSPTCATCSPSALLPPCYGPSFSPPSLTCPHLSASWAPSSFPPPPDPLTPP